MRKIERSVMGSFSFQFPSWFSKFYHIPGHLVLFQPCFILYSLQPGPGGIFSFIQFEKFIFWIQILDLFKIFSVFFSIFCDCKFDLIPFTILLLGVFEKTPSFIVRLVYTYRNNTKLPYLNLQFYWISDDYDKLHKP